MTIALLYGAGSGALHAVTGPDHVLALGPAALREPRASFRLGLHWGAGHALGTLLLTLPLLALSQLVHAPALAAWGERAAGLTLVLAAVWSLCQTRRPHEPSQAPARGPLLVGLLHGATGAGSLLLILPVLVAGSPARSAIFIGAFALGSALAMALLTRTIAQLGARLSERSIARFQRVSIAAAAALGSYWLLG